MKIINLARQNKKNIEIVASWLWEEWGQPGNYNFWYSWVESSLFTNKVPQTLVCVEDDQIIGTVSLWRCDLQSRQDIFPWLGGLYVEKNYRSRGIAKQMVECACEEARKLLYNKLFLFSELNGFFEKLDWEYMCDIPDEFGKMVKLYQKEL